MGTQVRNADDDNDDDADDAGGGFRQAGQISLTLYLISISFFTNLLFSSRKKSAAHTRPREGACPAR